MTLKELTLHQFRSYDEARFTFGKGVTIISGPNGSGKTNILEAIYVLCNGKSFRDGDGDLTKFNEDWWRVEGVLDSVSRDVRYDALHKPNKQLVVDAARKTRFTYKEQLPVVLFEPEDLRLIDGSPTRRREFLDRILVQLSPAYRQHLRAYERSLVQRNNLLKQSYGMSEDDTLFVWDVSLAEHGAALIEERQKLVDDINGAISQVYTTIAQHENTVHMEYSVKKLEDTRSFLLSELQKRTSADRQRGFTSVGPHRDDIRFTLNDNEAQTSASRGEVRSIVLSLKLIEANLYKEFRQTSPILLFDDVFSELDETRRTHLLEAQHDMQLILTTTDADIAAEYKAKHIKLS